METLNEQDLEWLTKAEARLIRMRKREAANSNFWSVMEALSDMIEKCEEARSWLQDRFKD